MVEQRIHKPKVGSSTLPPATTKGFLGSLGSENHEKFFTLDHSEDFTNSRLVGRSVWNTKWKLVIPGRALLADPIEGLDRFMRTVTDVQLYLKTYSHSGN